MRLAPLLVFLVRCVVEVNPLQKMRPKSVVCTQQQGLECSKTVNILLVSQKEENLMVQNCKTESGESFVAFCSIFQTNLSFQKRAAIPNPLASSLFKIA